MIFCLGNDVPCASLAETSAPAGWKLVWQDEFNERELSPKKWNVLTREQSKHNELQYYVPDEVYIENDCLRLRSRKRDYGTQHYTSGRVDTSGKFSPVYGRFEIRAKLPGGKGLWPAHWLYPQNRDWPMEQLMARAVAEGRERQIPEARPWYTEIDIMEFLGHEPNVLYATFHYHTFDGEKKSKLRHAQRRRRFHQGLPHLRASSGIRTKCAGSSTASKFTPRRKAVPHAPHYLIFNTAVGGQWPGNPDDKTVFPQYHDIDYVRVYQRPEYFRCTD